jgi:hypothetical protein
MDSIDSIPVLNWLLLPFWPEIPGKNQKIWNDNPIIAYIYNYVYNYIFRTRDFITMFMTMFITI